MMIRNRLMIVSDIVMIIRIPMTNSCHLIMIRDILMITALLMITGYYQKYNIFFKGLETRKMYPFSSK